MFVQRQNALSKNGSIHTFPDSKLALQLVSVGFLKVSCTCLP